MTDTSKITVSHRERLCLVYIRQSTLVQTRVNTESLERQYELAGLAERLGWDRSLVRVIDDDLGMSGAEAAGRAGFQDLVAEVALGRVGLIAGLEASRLARSNADWYQLLDLCGMTGTLIADGDGIYDPSAYSDRLVLGLKGTISEAELHLIKGRLIAGMRHKAAKGELRITLPAGYEYDPAGQPVLCADEAARGAIATVFRRFAELGSARQVMLSMRDDRLDLPRWRAGGRIEWVPASYGAIIGILTNPCYAGAFAFGRTRSARQAGGRGQPGRSVRRPVPVSEWEVLITGHHPGYITWEDYLGNQQKLHANCLEARLAAVTSAEAALAAEQARQPASLTADELRWLQTAGADLRAVFDAPSTTPRDRKRLIRAMICEITVTVDKQDRTAALTIYWEGGASTSITATLPRLGTPWRTTDASTVELVRRLAEYHDDAAIASTLARQGRRTGTGLDFTQARVADLRHAHGIPAGPRQNVTPAGHDADVVSISKAAAELGVGISTIYRWLADGFIPGEQAAPGAPWRIRLTSEIRAKITGQAPDGWLPLNQAAAALGVARQTVLHKVQRGELAAVHVRHGRRSGLRIQVKPGQPGLFEKP